MAKKYGVTIFIFILIFSAFFLFFNSRKMQDKQDNGFPPLSVLSTHVKEINWQPNYETVGTLTAINSVIVTSEITAKVKDICFFSGETIQQGQILVILDKAQLEAQLKENEAQLVLTQSQYMRLKKLMDKNFISASDLDQAKANYEQAQAVMLQTKAQLEYYIIKAPFTGVVGLLNISVGQLIQPGNTIANLESFDPIYINFSLPQNLISNSLLGRNIKIKISRDSAIYEYMGEIVGVDAHLDEGSRTVLVRAKIDNPSNLLMPGMFGEVSIPVGNSQKVIEVPSTAVLNSLYGNYIFKVEKTTLNSAYVTQIPVKIITSIGDNLIVSSDELKQDDVIVKMGAFKLKDQMPIKLIDDGAGKE